jgi:hypothetical protein
MFAENVAGPLYVPPMLIQLLSKENVPDIVGGTAGNKDGGLFAVPPLSSTCALYEYTTGEAHVGEAETDTNAARATAEDHPMVTSKVGSGGYCRRATSEPGRSLSDVAFSLRHQPALQK